LINILRLSCTVLISTLIFISCNQPPPTASQSLIPTEDLIYATHVTSDTWNLSQSSSSFEKELKMGIADRVLLGQNAYSKTDLLFRYAVYLPDTTKSYLRNGTATITKAWMVMKPSYILGDSTKPFGFSAYQIRSPWGLLNFNRDSLSVVLNTRDQQNVISNVPSNPTRKDSIKFNIEPSVVAEWATYDSTNSNSKKNYGLIFIPTEGTDRYLGFRAVTSSTESQITYMKFAIHKDSWGQFEDTIRVTPDMDTHIMEKQTLPTNNSEIYLEGSYVSRGFIHFDLSKIPQNIILNKAEFSIQVDVEKSLFSSPATDSLEMVVMGDSTKKSLNSDSSIVTLFKGDITWMMQKWIQRDNIYPNQGAMLYISNDASTAEKIILHGSQDADKSKRPKLDIYYTQKK
jgi:hypothetical protein